MARPGLGTARRRTRRPPHAAISYVLLDEWQRLARRNLLTALDHAFGHAGPGVPMRALVARGTAGRALVESADRDNDLLVVGAGRMEQLAPALFVLGEPLLPRPRRLPGPRGAAVPTGGGTDQRAPAQPVAPAPGHPAPGGDGRGDRTAGRLTVGDSRSGTDGRRATRPSPRPRPRRPSHVWRRGHLPGVGRTGSGLQRQQHPYGNGRFEGEAGRPPRWPAPAGVPRPDPAPPGARR